eukprot:CAMPEP_0202863994 /NCGR_PEP_ID=MMETSP1391-20130828/4410_1 /ASSEMBLY_ACC=CAM_ASM_000867 /TAXON_ID=1034604 /ORGANISM="Chlamydomonas leiostraca, Strain SAG 11-49" /LENGTH=76 /DNA_ID=CAMNT_0049543695 /DNA_START=328 /DNA_END=558 /DNA_ORIENTATION=-
MCHAQNPVPQILTTSSHAHARRLDSCAKEGMKDVHDAPCTNLRPAIRMQQRTDLAPPSEPAQGGRQSTSSVIDPDV